MPKFTVAHTVCASLDAEGWLRAELVLPASTVAHAAPDRPLFAAVVVASSTPRARVGRLTTDGGAVRADLPRPAGRLGPVRLDHDGPTLPAAVLLAGKYTGSPALPAVKVEWPAGAARARGVSLWLGTPTEADERRPIDGAKNRRNFDRVAGEPAPLRAVVEETGALALVPRQVVDVGPASGRSKRRVVRVALCAADLPLDPLVGELVLHLGYTPAPRGGSARPADAPTALGEGLADLLPTNARRRFLAGGPVERGEVVRGHLERLSSLLWAAQLVGLSPTEQARVRASVRGRGDPLDDDRLVDVAVERLQGLARLLGSARRAARATDRGTALRELVGAVQALEGFDVVAAVEAARRADGDAEPCGVQPGPVAGGTARAS